MKFKRSYTKKVEKFGFLSLTLIYLQKAVFNLNKPLSLALEWTTNVLHVTARQGMAVQPFPPKCYSEMFTINPLSSTPTANRIKLWTGNFSPQKAESSHIICAYIWVRTHHIKYRTYLRYRMHTQTNTHAYVHTFWMWLNRKVERAVKLFKIIFLNFLTVISYAEIHGPLWGPTQSKWRKKVFRLRKRAIRVVGSA